MRRASIVAGVGLVLLATQAGAAQATRCGEKQVTAAAAQCSNVATARKPATYRLKAGDGDALEVTARPIAADGSYLVQVFVEDGGPKLLGTFSFLPARLGHAQTFVLPKPDAASGELTLSIKLIPANPARALKDAAVEIVDARLAK